jgi:membrane-associated phospholipid phosphatase
MRKEKYLALYTWVHSRPRLARTLSVTDTVITYLTVAVYGFFLGYLVFGDLITGLRFLAVTATPFVIITLVRHIINAPRPYEVFEHDALAHLVQSGKKGHAFPSRHVASVFIIGSALCFVCLPVAIPLLVLGFVLAACRVALGRHFLRDVTVGVVLGVISGVGGMLITMI